LAKKVFAKNFKWNPLAQSIYDDMIQEAVTRLFELSGKTKEMANGKYSENYASFWIAHNAMLAFLKTWERQNKWCTVGDTEGGPKGDILGQAGAGIGTEHYLDFPA